MNVLARPHDVDRAQADARAPTLVKSGIPAPPITCQVGVMILALASPRLVRTLPPSPVSLQTRVSFSGLAMIRIA